MSSTDSKVITTRGDLELTEYVSTVTIRTFALYASLDPSGALKTSK